MNDQENFREYMWNKDLNASSRSECAKCGCRKLETRCLECGRAVNKITIPVIEREWISVKDRVPEKPMGILIYGSPTCGTCSPEKRVLEGGFNGTKFISGEFDCSINASHWMPLPSPPED